MKKMFGYAWRTLAVVAAVLFMAALLSGAVLMTGAEELVGTAEADVSLPSMDTEAEPVVAETEAITDTETVTATETTAESQTNEVLIIPPTKGEAASDEDVLDGLYERGRQWVEENPEISSAVATALGVIIYGLTQFIGYIKVKKPVVTSSNNAVEIYKKSVDHVDEINQKTEKRVQDMLAASSALLEESKKNAKVQAEELQKSREAVVLLAKVVGRLMEESSLPSRIRDEIHTMVAEADLKLIGERSISDGYTVDTDMGGGDDHGQA